MHDPTRPIHLESLYLVAGIELGGHTVHRVRLAYGALDGDARAQLTLDPNKCTLDAFGDPLGCTRMAVRTLDVKLTPVTTDDPRRLFSVEGEGLAAPSLRLVLVGDAPAAARLLVVGAADELTDVVPLHPRVG
jgi:hypothetical protein